MTTPLHINTLTVENVKKINLVRIDADGKPVILTGDNAAGKSSVLDSLLLALTNKGLDDPIRHGTKKGVIKLRIGGADRAFDIEKSITEKGSYLRVHDKDGKQIGSPQQFVDGLIGGRLALDPLAFLTLKPKEQADALKEALGLAKQFAELDTAHKTAFESRTASNREKDRAEKVLGTLKAPAPDMPEDEVQVGNLITKRDEAKALQSKVERCTASAMEANDDVEMAEEKVQAAELALKAAKDAAANAVRLHKLALDALDDAKANLPAADYVAKLDAEIGKVDTTNAAVRAGKEYRRMFGEFKTARDESDKLTKQLDDIASKKAGLLKGAKFPVDGVSITDDGVFAGDIPLSQMSTAEQIKLSAAIAMAGSPDLRLLIIREGALVNTANRAALYAMAADRGYQIFEERFTESPGTEGLFIVEGEVKFVDGKPV